MTVKIIEYNETLAEFLNEFKIEILSFHAKGFNLDPNETRVLLEDRPKVPMRKKLMPPKIVFAYDDGTPVGFIKFSIIKYPDFIIPIKNRIGMIEAIYLKEGARGKGIGTQLIRFAENWLIGQNVDWIDIDVAAFNRGAIKLYKRQGYTIEHVKLSKKVP